MKRQMTKTKTGLKKAVRQPIPQRDAATIFAEWNEIPDNYPGWVFWFIEKADENANEAITDFTEQNLRLPQYRTDNVSPEEAEKANYSFGQRLNERLLAHWKIALFDFDLQTLYEMKKVRKDLFITDDYLWGKSFIQKKIEWTLQSIDNHNLKLGQPILDCDTLIVRLNWKGTISQISSLLCWGRDSNMIDPMWPQIADGKRTASLSSKITWRGKENQLAALFQWLATKNSPLTSRDWQQVLFRNFEKPTGIPLSKNLTKLVAKPSLKLTRWWTETRGILEPKLSERP